MHKLIITAIKNNTPLSYSGLEDRALKRGLSLDDLDDALTKVHKDKRIRKKVTDGEIIYSYEAPKVKDQSPHLTWLRENYPRPENFVMPFPEIDMSWIFLSPDDMVEYKANVSGRNKWQLQKAKSRQ